MAGFGEPADEARHAAEEFLSYVHRNPEWPRLYQEFAAHAARNDAFRTEFAVRQRALRARMADVSARGASAFSVEPPARPRGYGRDAPGLRADRAWACWRRYSRTA
jgi:hypothetical protein